MIRAEDLPPCDRRYFEPAGSGYGGIIKGVTLAVCPTYVRGNRDQNCRNMLRAGICPQKFKCPEERDQ